MRLEAEKTQDHEALEIDLIEAVTSGSEGIHVDVVWSWNVSWGWRWSDMTMRTVCGMGEGIG